MKARVLCYGVYVFLSRYKMSYPKYIYIKAYVIEKFHIYRILMQVGNNSAEVAGVARIHYFVAFNASFSGLN